MEHPCQVKTANFPPLANTYSLFLVNSVPNISARPDFNLKHSVYERIETIRVNLMITNLPV